MGEADSNLSQPFGTYLLYTIQNPYSSAWQSSSETVFTLFSLFFLVDHVLASQIKTVEET